MYAQLRFHPEDACFVRTSHRPVGKGPVEELQWLDPALATYAKYALALNNHQRHFRTKFPGMELEYKYNLPSTTDIWAISKEILKAIRRGELTGCRPEYRDDFQINSFDNHLFEVSGPNSERGYASFIPTVEGGHVLKRKWFTEDAFARREQIQKVEVRPDAFEEYLRSERGLQVRAMPPFKRIRYDVQLESMTTGHVYGIMSDHCSLLAAPEIALSQ
ncbi:hypothetical protein [Streptomyces sp. NPDC050804]|uniref:hypothetical protein n=1 Tax=Streptomyces sp. NPDC050804 TaxID=3154745 RepID=UPI003428A842